MIDTQYCLYKEKTHLIDDQMAEFNENPTAQCCAPYCRSHHNFLGHLDFCYHGCFGDNLVSGT